MEKLIQVGYLAQFMKKPDDNPTRGRRETIVAKVEMPAEEGTKWIKEADKHHTNLVHKLHVCPANHHYLNIS